MRAFPFLSRMLFGAGASPSGLSLGSRAAEMGTVGDLGLHWYTGSYDLIWRIGWDDNAASVYFSSLARRSSMDDTWAKTICFFTAGAFLFAVQRLVSILLYHGLFRGGSSHTYRVWLACVCLDCFELCLQRSLRWLAGNAYAQYV